MKTLVCGITPPKKGGSEQHIYEIVTNINHEDLFILSQKGSDIKLKNKTIEVPYINSANTYIRNLSFGFFTLFYIFKFVKMKGEKQVHFHENFLFYLTPLMKLFGVKVINTIHGCRGFKFYDNKFLWKIYSFFLRKSDIIIAVSPDDKKVLKKYFVNNELIYLPNGVDTKIFNYDGIVKDNIVFIGRMHEQKGVKYLIEAFNSIKKEYPNFRLILAGPVNDYSNELKNKYDMERIDFVGGYNREQLVEYLSSAYMVVLPSLWEGLPLTLFEALASGRPLIISNLPSISPLVQNGEAMLVEPGNSKVLKEAMNKLLKDKGEADKLGVLGKSLSKKYDWGEIAKEYWKVYNGTFRE